MSETLRPEIIAMREWMEKEIVARGICPPLVRLMHDARTDDNGVDWSKLSQEIDIVSFAHLSPFGTQLKADFLDQYLNFITNSCEGTGPLAKFFILPDFPRNRDYDRFMAGFREKALENLLETRTGGVILNKAIKALAGSTPVTVIEQVLRSDTGRVDAALDLVTKSYRQIYFYGRAVLDRDIADLPDERGPQERYKVLTRSPYFGVQLLNVLRAIEYSSGFNQTTMEARNTKLALATDLTELEERMQKFRS